MKPLHISRFVHAAHRTQPDRNEQTYRSIMETKLPRVKAAASFLIFPRNIPPRPSTVKAKIVIQENGADQRAGGQAPQISQTKQQLDDTVHQPGAQAPFQAAAVAEKHHRSMEHRVMEPP